MFGQQTYQSVTHNLNQRMNVAQKMMYLSMMVTAIRSLSQSSRNHKCTISFRHQENSANLTFTSCRASEKNGLTVNQITDWKTCQDICCHRLDQNLTVSLQQCLKPDILNKGSSDVLQLASNFILFIIAVITVATIIYGTKRLYKGLMRKYGRNSKGLQQQITEDIITKSIYSIIWLNRFSNASNEANNSKAKCTEPNSSLSLNNTYCTICKDIKIDIETVCGHSFHTECLFNWLQRRTCCPKCPKTTLHYIKLYCTSCYCQYFILDVDYYKRLGAISMDCTNCLTKEEFKNKVVRYYWVDGKQAPSQQSINRNQVQ